MQSKEFKSNVDVDALKCASDLVWALGLAIGTKSSAALMTACSEIYGMGRRLREADARALWAYRVLARHYIATGGPPSTLAAHEARLIMNAETIDGSPSAADRTCACPDAYQGAHVSPTCPVMAYERAPADPSLEPDGVRGITPENQLPCNACGAPDHTGRRHASEVVK